MYIGILMIALLFIGMFSLCAYHLGIKDAVIIWGIVFGGAGYIFLALSLITGN